MTYQTPSPPTPQAPSTPGAADVARDVAGTAREEASGLTHEAAERGHRLAGEAGAEAKDVGREAGRQVSDLYRQSRAQLTDQAREQQGRVADGLRALGSELDTMARASDDPGMASDLAGQAATRAEAVASWLEGREPGDVLEEVKELARRRPGAFLAGAAVAGVLVGRLTRGLASDTGTPEDTRPSSTPTRVSGTTGTPAPVGTAGTAGSPGLAGEPAPVPLPPSATPLYGTGPGTSSTPPAVPPTPPAPPAPPASPGYAPGGGAVR